MLSGLPVILNRRRGQPVPELTDEICILVENSPSGFGRAIDDLLTDASAREALGRRAGDHAWQTWSPEVTERRFADIYRAVAGTAQDARPSNCPTP
jgi:glycosyltransferase involved in cell wall biosynthesis